jgi:membrane protein
MGAKAFWELLKEAGSGWWRDNAPRLGAALAYYTIFSLAPVLLITVAVCGLIYGRAAAEGQLLGELRDLVGEDGAVAIQTMLANASQPSSGIVATVTGLVMLLVGATSLFSELQDSLNLVWEMKPPGGGVMTMVKARFLSFSMVMGTAFLLLVSLVVSAGLAAFGKHLGQGESEGIGRILHFLASFLVVTLLFAMIYKFLPDAIIAWRDVWLGSAVTALLFSIGKSLIGLYLGHSAMASTFGAAGSLAVLLFWFYYSSQIFLFGAELTKAYANRYGSGIVPSAGATRVDVSSPAPTPRTPERVSV